MEFPAGLLNSLAISYRTWINSLQGPHNVTLQYRDWKPLTIEIGYPSHPYLSLSIDVLKFAISFYAATFIPAALAWVSSYRMERKTLQVHVDIPAAASPHWTGKILENPSIQSHLEDDSLLPAGHGGHERGTKYITAYDPSTGYHIDTLPLPSKAQLDELIQKAHAAFSEQRHTTFPERRLFLRTFKRWMMANLRDIVRVGARDTGKTEVDATFGELLTVLSKIDYLLAHGAAALAPETRPGNLLLAHKRSQVYYEPLGVVCAIVSWNYPLHNALSPILAALFTGNTVVLKCSELVYWSSYWIVEALKSNLIAVGMNPNAVQLVCCYPEDAEIITKHPLIRHITFIGSEIVGKKVASAAAESLIPTCIELGGKDCALLLPTTNLKFFASTFMRAAFQANGQNCIGIERFIVHRSIYQQFIDIMQPRVAALRCGPSLSSAPGKPDGPIETVDCGSMISSRLFDELESILSSAEDQGARILAGGKRFAHPVWKSGHYFQPTLIVDVTTDMHIARNELFAPVMTVMPYDTIEEAVVIANSTRYGLGSAVFGNDKTECRQVAAAMKTGMVAINDFGVFYLNQAMPFGGVNASGFGRFGGPEGLRSLCSLKSVSEDRFFTLIQTGIPGPLDYPLPAQSKSWTFLSGLLNFAYGRGIKTRVAGLYNLAAASLSK